jgi:hypothetical protein
MGWFARRPGRRSWLYVAAVANTMLLVAVWSTIDQFRAHGLTVSSLVYAALMLWLAQGAAAAGTIGVRVAQSPRR